MANGLDTIATEQLKAWAERFPWWGAVRMELHNRGLLAPDSVLFAARMRERLTPASVRLKTISNEELHRSAMLGIIDDFLREGEHRIVIDEEMNDAPMDEINSEEEMDDEFVSEELAEIYAKQHLFDLAIEIYQKLSLQDSQKSVYFAELIEHLNAEKEKENNKK